MRTKTLLLSGFMLAAVSLPAAAQTAGGGISKDMLAEIKNAQQRTPAERKKKDVIELYFLLKHFIRLMENCSSFRVSYDNIFYPIFFYL